MPTAISFSPLETYIQYMCVLLCACLVNCAVLIASQDVWQQLSGIDFLAANSVRVPWVHVTSAKVVLSYLFMFTLDCLAFPVQPSAFTQDGAVVEQFQ